jgi:hypothetical protein
MGEACGGGCGLERVQVQGEVVAEFYILDADKRVRPATMQQWARQFERGDDRRVALDEVGEITVSTVFLGLNHNWGGKGPPLLFETMVFRNGDGDELWRSATWRKALSQHRRALALVRASARGK